MRVQLVVAYNGAGFHGLAVQPGIRTVAGVMTDAIARWLRQPVILTVAGRTDTGVHAWGQVVTFDVDPAVLPGGEINLMSLRRSLNRTLGPAVAIREAEVVPTGFDARRSALSRQYRYQVHNHPVGNPFLATTAWHVAAPLELAAMRLACDPLIGVHDFSSFCRVPRRTIHPADMVRRLIDARWLDLGGGLLRFDVEASAFCHQMVRAMVGLMVAIGLGRRRPGDVMAILRAKSRAATPDLAPAHGLCLWQVVYPS